MKPARRRALALILGSVILGAAWPSLGSGQEIPPLPTAPAYPAAQGGPSGTPAAPEAGGAPVPLGASAYPGSVPGAGGTPATASGVPGPEAGAAGTGLLGEAAATEPALASGLGPGRDAPASALPMLGDMSPPISILRRVAARQTPNRPPPIPPASARSLLAPSVRGFKIAENQSPVPQDRVFFNFNYYDDVNKDLNRFFETPIEGLQIYRYVWGFEKTFNKGNGSFGLRLPLNNIYARSTERSLNSGGSSTALGNLTVFMKHVFWADSESGSLVTGGLAVTPRTGPRQFAGAPFLGSDNTTSLQPFLGYFLRAGNFYVQGFEALDVPIDFYQPTLLYNDIGVGYFLYVDDDPDAFLRTVAPTVEAHANIPLNHRGEYNLLDRFGTPDIVNITAGLNLGIRSNAALTFGLAVPVTGPRPFDLEPQVLLNVYFGRSRRNLNPPIIGG